MPPLAHRPGGQNRKNEIGPILKINGRKPKLQPSDPAAKLKNF